MLQQRLTSRVLKLMFDQALYEPVAMAELGDCGEEVMPQPLLRTL